MSADRYSQNAKHALRMGHMLARQHRHSEVDTDHLFVGILQTQGSIGHQVLAEFGLQAEALTPVVANLHHQQPAEQEKLPFSVALRAALTYAIAEAEWLEHKFIGTEHFLLGLMRINQGQLPLLLNQLDLGTDQIRTRVRRLLQDGTTEVTLEAAHRMAKLSELGRRVFFAAEYLAHSHQHAAVAPQHLLLALAQERRSVACKILPDCGLDIDHLQQEVQTLPSASLAAQSLTNWLVDGAVERAEILGTHYTGTEHMLLAMTVDRDGQQLLTRYGVDLQCLQQQLRAILLR